MGAKVEFILGRSGSGKTHTVYERIKENEALGKRSILIVPDRIAFETERELSKRLSGGMLYASVLSFTRLAQRVMDETGRTEEYLSPQGRLMLIRRILDEKKTELKAFSRVSAQRGFAEECDEIILKCKRFSIEPEELIRDDLPLALQDKLSDFSIVYSALIERMKNRYIDGEDSVNSLIDRLARSFVAGADVFIDAPDMMSEQSIRIINTLFSVAERVSITLRMDNDDENANNGLFMPDIASFLRLKNLAREQGCEIGILRLKENMRQTNKALKVLERILFSYEKESFTFAVRSIELHASENIAIEVKDAAQRIREAVMKGYRYNDIAVALCDFSSYAETVRRVFAMYDIPVFIDAKRTVSSHPTAELITASLRCVERNFRQDDFIAVMKTGLTDIAASDAEMLENHILRFNLSGKRLFGDEPSVKNNADINDFDRIEAARKKVAAPMIKLRDELRADEERSSSKRIEALFNYLGELKIAEKLKAECEELEKDPEMIVFALENRQIYDKIVELLDQIYVIIGDEKIGLSRFISVIVEGLDAYEVGVIPTMLDQVIVGDIASIHIPEVKQLYVLGANEGRFPSMRDDNAIINDRELAFMKKVGINAWDNAESLDRAERLRVYSLITKPTKKLYISYCNYSGSNKMEPARLVRSIGEAFLHAKRSWLGSEKFTGTNEASFAALANKLRALIDNDDKSEKLKKLYSHFCAEAEYKDALTLLTDTCYKSFSPEPIGKQEAKKLYGESINGSVSRLQCFNKCPYQHLARYGLKLNEREVYEFNNSKSGTLVHDALDMLIKRLTAKKADFKSLTREDIIAEVDDFLPKMIEDFQFGILNETAVMRTEAERLTSIICDAGFVIVRQLGSGAFTPYATEFGFGRREDDPPALEIVSSDNVRFRMRGVIDRIDTAEMQDGSKYFRIIDYKNYEKKFDFAELKLGLDIQLPLYAAAIQSYLSQDKPINAAGLFYFHIVQPELIDEADRDKTTLKDMRISGPMLEDEAIISANDEALVPGSRSSVIFGLQYTKPDKKNKKEGGYKYKMFVTEEEMEHTVSVAKDVSAKTLDGIMLGRAEASPYMLGNNKTSCTYCPYGSVCAFDTTSGGHYRRKNTLSIDKFFGRKEKKE